MQDTPAPTQAEAIVAAARRTKWNSARLALLGTCKLLALAGMIVGAIMLQRQETVASSWVAHTHQVLATVASLDANLKSAISDERGFVIGRDPADHEASEAAERQIDADLATLRALTADDSAQRSAVADLDRGLHRRLAILRRIAEGVAALPPRVIPDHAVLADANASAAEVGHELEAIRTEEQRRLAQRQAEVARTSTLLWGQLLGCGIVVAAGVFLMSAVVIGRRREQRHVTQLEHLNALLETKVLERTRALAASESRLRIYFECSAIGILVLRRHADGRITHDAANPAYLEIMGLTHWMLAARTLAELWPEDAAAAMAARVDACLRTRQTDVFTVERRLRGETCVLDVSVSPVRDGTGGDDGELVIACVRDMTRERRLTDQLIEQERARAEAAEREAAVFENSADVLAVIGVREEDGEARFVYEAINPAFEAIGGPPIAGLLGKSPTTWMPPAFATRMLDVWHRCLATGERTTWAESCALRTGTRDLEGVLTPVRDRATGRVTRLISTARDVTERNALLAAMHHGQRLEAIGRIAAGVAHDFNNILQAVLGSLELITEDLTDHAPAREFARIATIAASRGATLTRHLLGYARKAMLRPGPVNPAEFLREMREVLARVLAPTIAVTVDAHPDTPPLLADVALLQTALINLGVNAGDAMPEGGTLALSAFVDTTSDGAPVVIVARDTGTGMDPDTLARAIEPFFSTKGPAGSGLGLSMVHGFALQSGGEMRLTSTPGQGTRVELRLPRAEPAEPAVPAASDVAVSGGTVLLVDDTEDVRVTTSAFLVRAGFRVTREARGDVALARLAADPRIDAIICDFAMPGRNGIDVIIEGRRLRPGLPAVVITGFVDVESNAALPADVPVLRKPVARAVLIDTLRGVMGRGGTARGVMDAGADIGSDAMPSALGRQ